MQQKKKRNFTIIFLMELKPSTFALAVTKLFERLESKYSVAHQVECKLNRDSHIFGAIKRFYSNISVVDSDLLELNGLFGETLKQALDIVDRNKVKIYRDKSEGKELIEISSYKNIVYRLLPNVNYCSCKAFHQKVVKERQAFFCKHILGARLAIILGKITEEPISDDMLKLLTQSIV